MSIVERNDVDINKLFHWGQKYEITWFGQDEEEKTIVVYMRLLGDADVNRARVYALRKSAELRKKLYEPDSNERLAYLYIPESMETERLVALITGLSIRDITQNVIKSLNVKAPKSPKSDATLEENEKFQKAVDEYGPKREKEIRKAVEKETEKLQKELYSLPKEELIKRYEFSMINESCEQEALNAFREISAYLGAFKDENYKERFFDDFEQFQNLPTGIKKQFIDNHQVLEMGGEELKKLQRATQ